MQDHSNSAPNAMPEKSATSETGMVDILIVFAKHSRKLVCTPIVAAVIAGAISLAIPNVYQSTTKLLPPQQSQSGAAALLSQLGGVAGSVAGSAGVRSTNELYVGMLKSRTVADRLIDKFELQKLYNTDTLEKTRALLEANTTIAAGKDGLITIAVEDKDQKLVSKLANAYVTELLDLTKVLAVTEAGKRRLFFERELKQAKDNLASSEIALKTGLISNGITSVDSESRSIVEVIGRLRAQISAKEIELNSMREFVTNRNSEFRRANAELNSLRNKLADLEDGSSTTLNLPDQEKQPGLHNIKLLRDVKYYQMLYELLSKQYEAARLDEAKDPSILQVLDPAIQPERKSKPKRSIIVLAVLFVTFGVMFVWALITEKLIPINIDPQKVAALKFHLRRAGRNTNPRI